MTKDGDIFLKRFDDRLNQYTMINVNDINNVEVVDQHLVIDKYNEEDITKKYIIPYNQPFQWTPIEPLSQLIPQRRGGHSLNIDGDILIIFGGCNQEIKCFDELIFFHTFQHTYNVVKTVGP